MCYSAQIHSEFKKFVREFGAVMSLPDYVKLFWERQGDKWIEIARAIEQDFLRMPADTPEVAEIQRLIRENDAANVATWEAEIFKQRKRLADAERALATKPTKKAENDQRIATKKVDQLLGWIAAVKHTEPKGLDSRIYPGWYTHVMVSENGRRVVKPMRYQCRPERKPAFYDQKFPGTYNARRDNLGGFWKDLWGFRHGIMVAERFYENVERFDEQGKPYNAVIEFKPQGLDTMLVACLWSEWQQGDERLLSFAAITDEPPPEVIAAGHDRCIIPIKPENVDAWLSPGGDLDAMQAILEDRERSYYEHRMAA